MTSGVPLLDLKAQYATIRDEVRAAIDRVIESQQFILGPEVEALEREVATYCGARFGIGVSSGTDALLVALMALEVGTGDEVITTPYTFLATASSIVRLGAQPVFVDIDPATFNIDPSQIERKITRKTKAIVPVHLFGQMADMRAIMEIADRRGIPVVEDAAQAIGAERDGKLAASVGALGCLSFFPSKNLGAFGDAGMVLTNDERFATRARLLRSHGQERKHVAVTVGGNFRLDAIQAAVLRVKLTHLQAWTVARRARAAIYRDLFAIAGSVASTAEQATPEASKAEPCIVVPSEDRRARHVYNQFVVRASRRDDLRAFLAERGVASEVYYPRSLLTLPCFAGAGRRYRAADFPEAERATRESLAVPIFPEIELSMQERVVSAVTSFYSGRQ